MSTRRLSNIFKRKVFSEFGWIGSFSGLRERDGRWFRHQFESLSKLGGSLIVMKMGS